jgi:hypothetical protein
MGASFDCLPLYASRPPFLANSQQLTANNCQLDTVTCQLIFTPGVKIHSPIRSIPMNGRNTSGIVTLPSSF